MTICHNRKGGEKGAEVDEVVVQQASLQQRPRLSLRFPPKDIGFRPDGQNWPQSDQPRLWSKTGENQDSPAVARTPGERRLAASHHFKSLNMLI
jgi:hypothetical protein